jgi:hypothetical protein
MSDGRVPRFRDANQQARAQVGFQRDRIYLGTGKKRQYAAAQHGEEIDPVSGRVKVQEIPSSHTNQDFDEGDRNARPN